MNTKSLSRQNERGGAGIKFLIAAVLLCLFANAGYNYVPVAYEGASFRQEMDTAVVKGLAASGQLKPTDIVKAHIQHAAKDYNVPADALIEIRPAGNVVRAYATYSKSVDVLPFGLYKYKYQFDHLASPTGYLTKQ